MPANPVVGPRSLEDLATTLAGGAAVKPAEIDVAAVGALALKPLQEVARGLGLTGVSRLKKDALVAAVWQAWQAMLQATVAAAPHNGTKIEVTNGTGAHHAGDGAGVRKAEGKVDARAANVSKAFEAAKMDQTIDGVTGGVSGDESNGGASADAEAGESNAVAPVAHKYELTRPEATAAREAPADIPWGYGRDRVTAMPVDPDRLFVYWEVLEESIARARAALGPGGHDAWLSLRVYDVTGRIFDGTNAHSSFDQGIDRNARQWFFTIGKPTSEAVIEIGMRSRDGAFAKIARSGRVDFPRRDPVEWSEPEWMTVHASGVEVVRGWMPPSMHPGGAGPGGGGPGVGGPGAADLGDLAEGAFDDGGPSAAWDVGLQLEGPERLLERHEWEEVHVEGGVTETYRRIEWEEQSTITSWQEGPFTYPVEVPSPVFESFVGKTRVFRSGPRTRVVYGPWQVVIRGLGATSASQVVSRWEVYRSWSEERGREVTGFSERAEADGGGPTRALRPGASERLMVGASERRWRGASEVRLGGASEIFMVGASERRLMGASELSFLGASERVRRGASERRLRGASEYRLGGASERRLGGASEERLGGASEWRLGGASERHAGGGSEHRFMGASENTAGPYRAPGASPSEYQWPEVAAPAITGDGTGSRTRGG
ncbi:MAG TPA: DUF4912 domain-containing protein [Polyangia bacterium]